jgi:uncharacterized protein
MDPVILFELPATDMQRAKAFYEKVFGWNINSSYDRYFYAHTTETDEKIYSQSPGVINGAIQKKDDIITSTRIVINVSNLDNALDKVLAEGGRIFVPKTKIPGGYYSVIYDTEANEINLVEKNE